MAGGELGLPTGVEFIGKSIRIRFTINGTRRSETLALPQTAKGVKTASDLRTKVISLSKLGVLTDQTYSELFPNTTYVASSHDLTFSEFAQSWLDRLEVVKPTRENYRIKLNLYWMPHFATRPISSINTLLIREKIAKTRWKSQSLKRIAISVLKRLLKAAVIDGILEKNPADPIQLPKNNNKQVEAFSAEEANKIIAWMYDNLQDRAKIFGAFFELAFYTGMRTAEIMALKWSEIDFEKRTAYICRIISGGSVEERTKTKKSRTIMLNSRAIGALEFIKNFKQERSKRKIKMVHDSPFVFQPSSAAEYIKWPTVPGHHFKVALKALGLPDRPQYNCRHTYATMCLMAGMAPAFIAGQLGHNVQILLSTYAKWIGSSGDWGELDKLEARIIGTE